MGVCVWGGARRGGGVGGVGGGGVGVGGWGGGGVWWGVGGVGGSSGCLLYNRESVACLMSQEQKEGREAAAVR